MPRTDGTTANTMDEAAGHRGISRRAILTTATVAAGAVAGISAAAADTSFGAPLVELHFPAGVLTAEQKAAMIKGVTDVLLGAIAVPPDQTRRLWVQLFETAADGGWGLGGQVLVPRAK